MKIFVSGKKKGPLMKIIHCSVWGDIEISDTALAIIDTPTFQRLHYIKQTGFAYKVFPTATSSRFEHSIGVYHVTRLLINEIVRKQPEVDPGPRIQELVCLAGLVHDIGHGPFSHLFDELVRLYTVEEDGTVLPWADHERRGGALFRDLVTRNNVSLTDDEVNFIVARVHDPPRMHWYDTLICNRHSSIDTDKMDYVVRDSLHFGMKFNTDVTRIMRNARVIDNQVCYCDRVRDEVDLFFQIRERMHRTIYRHPKIRYFETYLLSYVREYAPKVVIDVIVAEDVDVFLQMTDASFLSLVPRAVWMPVETRKAPALEQEEPMYRCEQWEKAKKYLHYYKRKEPDVILKKK